MGESEANIRKLFADAEMDQKAKGDESDLHIIIFDEIDALCRYFTLYIYTQARAHAPHHA